MSRIGFVGLSLLGFLPVAACGSSEGGEPVREAVSRSTRAEAPAPEATRLEEPVSDAEAVAEAPASAENVVEVEAPQTQEKSAVLPTPVVPDAPVAVERSAPAPKSEPEPEAHRILARAEAAYDGIRSLQADFTQAVTVPLLDQTQHSRGKIYIRRPDRFLMDFSQPEGDVVVADGQYFWMYYPSTDPKQVLRTSAREGAQQMDFQKEFLSNSTERYRAVLGESEVVDGRPAHVLTLTPKGPSGYRRVRIWVDKQDALVRRFEIVEENESVRRLELRNLKPNVSLADSLFRFTPPPGAEVFSQ